VFIEIPFLTDYAVVTNNTSDVAILESRLETIHTNTGCTDMYADGGFHSVEVPRVAEENDIEIHLTNMTGTAPTKIAITGFDIDTTSNVIARCPKGHTPTCGEPQKLDTLELVLARFFVVFRVYVFERGRETR